jgi:thioredoxin reductase (NADPH)
MLKNHLTQNSEGLSQYDVIIIGGGPAGLTAGIYLGRANRSTILLEKEMFGGMLPNIEWIENYPGFAKGVSGAHLASEILDQASNYGLQLKLTEVVGIEVSREGCWIRCSNGERLGSRVLIVAMGASPKKLNVPGEENLQGKGVFNCALCNGGKFAHRVVGVCGGGDAGITDSLYMTKIASKVILIEAMPVLTATAVLQKRASLNPKLEIRCSTKVEAIVGEKQVEAVEVVHLETGKRETLRLEGLFVHIGLEANTSYLKGIVALGKEHRVLVNEKMETKVPYVLAAGDIRSGSRGQIVSAAGDGAIAAISAERLLLEMP